MNNLLKLTCALLAIVMLVGCGNNTDTDNDDNTLATESDSDVDTSNIKEVLDDTELVYNYQSIYSYNDSSESVLQAVSYTDELIYVLEYSADGQQICTINYSGNKETVIEYDVLNEYIEIIDLAVSDNANIWLIALNHDGGYTLCHLKDNAIEDTYEVESEGMPGLLLDDSGKCILIDYFNSRATYLGLDGQVENSYSFDEYRIQNCVVSEGELYVYYYDQSDAPVMAKLSQQGEITDETYLETYVDSISSAEFLGSTLCYSTETGIYLLSSDGITQIIDWNERGIYDSMMLSSLYVNSDGIVVGSIYNEIFMFSLGENNDKSKTELTLAAFSPSEKLIEMVANFNYSNQDYMITITDYDQYNSDGDESQGMTKLNTEIISGDIPDIMDLSNVNAQHLYKMGILEDLYPYIDTDTEFSRDSFIQSVLKAMEYNGSLYGVTTTFSINTIIAKSSVVSDDSWTYSDLLSILTSAGSSRSFVNMGKEDLLEIALDYCLEEFVDIENATCSFSSDNFYNLLAVCRALPDQSENIGIGALFTSDEQGDLIQVEVNDFLGIQLYEKVWGEDIAYVGFPDSGSSINLRMNLGMSSDTEHKDVVWSFIRQMLTDDVQYNISEMQSGFPINANAFQNLVTDSMAVDYDEDNKEQAKASYEFEGTTIEIYNSTQAQVDKIIDLIDSSESTTTNDIIIKSIVFEEVPSYFSGSKSAEQVGEIIQNRVQTYLLEN